MNITVKTAVSAVGMFLVFGCAGAHYVKEAQQVTTEALEPVMLETSRLESDLSGKFSSKLAAQDTAEGLTRVIQTELAKTRRFTKVLLNGTEGDTYVIQPTIDSLDAVVKPIPTDPTRQKVQVKARVRLDVILYNQKNQKEAVNSFYDERTLEERVSSREKLAGQVLEPYYLKTVTVAFRAAADQLGNSFNPSYEMGTISKVEGKRAFVQINTSKIRKMPKKQQTVDIVDQDNKVLATLDELSVEEGSISGKIFQKGGGSVREGMTARARVSGLVQ